MTLSIKTFLQTEDVRSACGCPVNRCGNHCRNRFSRLVPGRCSFSNREERKLYNPGSNGSDSILDSANPMDLINRIRQAGSLDDATPPSDAIDAALKAFREDPAASTPTAQP